MPPARDEDWPRALRTAIVCAATLLGLLLVVDAIANSLTPVRGALWGGLAVLLFVVLLPDRVTAGEGWLASRGPVRRRTGPTAWSTCGARRDPHVTWSWRTSTARGSP
ncbi:hypothetical protein [Streptomyces sp. NPDC051909]|uniref:hypothetical protein n=1 Tax=Streptomyces sp. NPDC051909 TaxID=3154944 RepID=UPI003432DD42